MNNLLWYGFRIGLACLTALILCLSSIDVRADTQPIHTAEAPAARAEAPTHIAKSKPGLDEDMETEAKDSDEEDLALVEEVDVEKAIIEALKSETTVQEAPTIVTVVRATDLEDMGHRTVGDALQDIPSFMTVWNYYHTGNTFINRGFQMGGLVLHNTVDLFQMSGGNVPIGEEIPIETLRSIELISGPGGVLWGVNSFIGVINMVSKTADDLQGVEASAGWGSGRGQPGRFRAYVMGGEKLWSNRIKLFAHASYETWHHAELDFPYNNLIRPTAPNPLGPVFRIGPTTSECERSHMVVLTGNAHLGPLALYWHVPWGIQNRPSSWGGNPGHFRLGEDSIDCTDPANKDACLARVDPLRISRQTRWRVWEDYGMLRYRTKMLEDKLSVEARAYYIFYAGSMVNYVSLPPSSLLIDGVSVTQEYDSHRVSLIVDADAKLPRDNRLLFGGEIFWDYAPLSITDFHTRDATLDKLPFRPACPPDTAERRCPIPVNFESDRLNTGIFANWQSRVHRTLMLDAGARLQAAPGGSHPYDPLMLFSGAAVWTFVPDWNLKVNYAEGFRPPGFSRLNSNGEGINWGGNPDLRPERSRAIQGEINALLLKRYKTVRQLGLRANYSYTWILDALDILNGRNENVSDRGIHSVEFLADLRLQRGHWLGLSYSFLDQYDSQSGKVRSIPNQWGNLRAAFNLYNRQVFASTNLSIIGSLEGPSRHAPISAGMANIGNIDENGVPVTEDVSKARSSDLTMDRIPAFVQWNAGLRFLLPDQGLRFDADFYNLLDASGFYPVGNYDLTSFLTEVPNPRQGFSFFLKGEYRY